MTNITLEAFGPGTGFPPLILKGLAGRNGGGEEAGRGQTVVEKKSEGQGDMSIIPRGRRGKYSYKSGGGGQGIPGMPVSKQLRWWALEFRPEGLAREGWDRWKKGTAKWPFTRLTMKNRWV